MMPFLNGNNQVLNEFSYFLNYALLQPSQVWRKTHKQQDSSDLDTCHPTFLIGIVPGVRPND